MLHESHPYVAHSETSRAAAESVVNAGTQRARLMDYLKENGPSIDEQMQLGTGIAQSSQRPRRGELLAMGLIRDSGRTALTRSGRKAVLWEIVPAAERQKQGRLF